MIERSRSSYFFFWAYMHLIPLGLNDHELQIFNFLCLCNLHPNQSMICVKTGILILYFLAFSQGLMHLYLLKDFLNNQIFIQYWSFGYLILFLLLSEIHVLKLINSNILLLKNFIHSSFVFQMNNYFSNNYLESLLYYLFSYENINFYHQKLLLFYLYQNLILFHIYVLFFIYLKFNLIKISLFHILSKTLLQLITLIINQTLNQNFQIFIHINYFHYLQLLIHHYSHLQNNFSSLLYQNFRDQSSYDIHLIRN